MQFHGSFVSVSVWLKELLHTLSLYKICEHWFNVLDSQKNLHVPVISIRLLQIGLIVQHFHFYFLETFVFKGICFWHSFERKLL